VVDFRPLAGKVADFFVPPVEASLGDFHRQRLAGGEVGAPGWTHVLAESFQVGKLPLELLGKDSAESLREFFRLVQ